MREKDRGIWQSYSWRDCYAHVRDFALGLAAAGFKRGDKLSVLGDNRARLYWAQLAAQALGGMSVPLYQDSIASELAFVLGHAEVSVVVAEDQEQVDKVLSIAGELPSLRLVVYDDPRGMGAYARPDPQVLRRDRGDGRRVRQGAPGLFRARAGAGQRRRHRAPIAYTSGTTGQVEGRAAEPRQHDRHLRDLRRRRAAAARRQLALLPADGLGRRHDLLARHQHGVAAPPAIAPRAPRRCSATCASWDRACFLAPPRIWENMLTGLQVKAADASWLKRRVYRILPRARRAARAAEERRQADPGRHAGSAIGSASSSSTVRCATSWACATRAACLTGGAPLGADTFRFFRSFGVNLKQVYGATEASAARRPAGRRRGRSQHGRAHRARARRCASASAARWR